MSRIWRWVTLGIVLLAATAGHLAYWYFPRAIEERPDAASPVVRLLGNEDLPIAVWMPRPHQNLGQLARHLGSLTEVEAWTRSLGRLLELRGGGLPSFGPFAVPPSSEICLAADESGERLAVSAQVYPLLAAFARLSGRLAGNPWLAGGTVVHDGRRFEVSWRGRVWQVRTPGVREPGAWSEELPGAGLAVLRLRQEVEPMPAGSYVLRQTDQGIELASSSAVPLLPLETLGMAPSETFLLILAGARKLPAATDQAIAFFALDEPSSNELPRTVLLSGAGPRRWDIPGKALLRLSGRRPREASLAGWRLSALDGTSLGSGSALAPHLAPLLLGSSGEPLRWGLWLDLRRGMDEVRRIGRMLSELPFAPPSEVRRWRDAVTLLQPISERYGLLTLVVTDTPRGARLRLSATAEGWPGGTLDRPEIDSGESIP